MSLGMYNVPSFTLARSVGGLVALYWRYSGRDDTKAIVLASVSLSYLCAFPVSAAFANIPKRASFSARAFSAL